MGKIILYVVSLGLILLIASGIWPYYKKYMIDTDLESGALYGTKHTIEDTQRFLIKKLKERRVDFDPENLYIDKNEYNTVKIRLIYQDRISFLGIVLKELEFQLDVTEKEVKEVL